MAGDDPLLAEPYVIRASIAQVWFIFDKNIIKVYYPILEIYLATWCYIYKLKLINILFVNKNYILSNSYLCVGTMF